MRTPLQAILWEVWRTSRLDLLNPSSSFNQRWLAYLDDSTAGDVATASREAMQRLIEVTHWFAKSVMRPVTFRDTRSSAWTSFVPS